MITTGLTITNIIFLVATLYSTYKAKEYKERLDFTQRDHKAKLEYQKNQEATLNRDSNRELINAISPLLKDVSYVRDNNGDLVFYDNQFNEIIESDNAVVNLLNDEKLSDSSLYYYNSLYKVYKVGTDEDKANYLVNKDNNEEIKNIPDNILVKFSSNEKNKKIDVKVSRDDELYYSFVNSKNGLITLDERMDLNHKDHVIKMEFNSKYRLPNSVDYRSIYSEVSDKNTFKPSEFASFGTNVKAGDICVFISEELMNTISNLSGQYANFKCVVTSQIDEKYAWTFTAEPSAFGVSINDRGESWYAAVPRKGVDVKYKNIACNIYYMTESEVIGHFSINVLAPRIAVRFNSGKVELYLH